MSKELHRLLKSHEFLKSAIEQHGHRLSPVDIARLTGNLDTVFLEIVEHDSPDPRVTLAQARFLVTTLSEMPSGASGREAVVSACQRHLDRLTLQLSKTSAPACASEPVASEYRYLDSLTDRVAIIGADYRYIFTNKANARFHGQDQARFVGLPNWSIMGERFFRLRNKPRFDQCLRGETCSCILAHPGRDPALLYWATFQPVRNEAGEIDAVMVTSRDVSNLPIPPEMITPNP